MNTTPKNLAALIKKNPEIFTLGRWDGQLFPCPDGCNDVVNTKEWRNPCQECGAKRSAEAETGQRVYVKVRFLWFFQKRKLVGYLWR